jgi:hypothetical protein
MPISAFSAQFPSTPAHPGRAVNPVAALAVFGCLINTAPAAVAKQVKPLLVLLGAVRKRHEIVYLRTAVRAVRNMVPVPQSTAFLTLSLLPSCQPP